MTELPTDYDGHIMRTPDEWCRIKQIQILDADGWRGCDAKDWSEPLTELDFEERALVCTQRSIAAQPAGEHHTGTLVSDEIVQIGALGIGDQYDWRPEARSVLEAAYPAIRQQVAEQIAGAIADHRDQFDPFSPVATELNYAIEAAREIGGGA